MVVGGCQGCVREEATTSHYDAVRCQTIRVYSSLSQDTLPSPFLIGSLSQYYYSHCTTSDVYATPGATSSYFSKYGSDYRILQYGSG